MVGFRLSSEEQAVNQLLYQVQQPDGAVAKGSSSVRDELYVQNRILFEGDWTAILEGLEGVTLSLKYTSDLLIKVCMKWARLCQLSVYAQAGAKEK